MYFSFLQRLQNRTIDQLGREALVYAFEHRSLYEQYPESYALLLNKYPDAVDSFTKNIVTGYAYHLLNEKGKGPFSAQDIFPRFYRTLNEANKRAIAKYEIGHAVSYGDPEFFEILINLFSGQQRLDVLKHVWRASAYGICQEVPADQYNSKRGRKKNLAMLKRLIDLAGIDAIREAENTDNKSPFLVLSNSLWQADLDLFNIVAPLAPDTTTILQLLTQDIYIAQHCFSNPALAQRLKEILPSHDYENVILNAGGFSGVMQSNDLSYMEETWKTIPTRSQHRLLYQNKIKPNIVYATVSGGNEVALRFIMGKIPPHQRLRALKGESQSPFNAIWMALKKQGHHHIVPVLKEFLNESELGVIAAALPDLRHYFIEHNQIEEPLEPGAPLPGTAKWWQLNGEGPERWKAMLGIDPPHPDLAKQSPFFFSINRYNEFLPICQLASALEKTQELHINAYKLSVLFKSVEEARKFVDKYSEEERSSIPRPDDRRSSDEKKMYLHNACLFDIPEQGLWTPRLWSAFLQKYPLEGRKYVGLAPGVENLIKSEGRSFPATLKEMQSLAARLFYQRQAENPNFAVVAHTHQVAEKHFNQCLDIIKISTKTKDDLPNLKINGDDIGLPGIYMERLAPNDPTGFILGHIVGNCQSVGKAGEKYALHGMSSPYGGFYVWRKREGASDQSTDPILAESWLWISKNNALVFDSFERKDAAHNVIVRPFLEQFAFEAQSHGFDQIRLGTGGQTPKDIGFVKADKPERWKDFTYGHNEDMEYDSKSQWVISSQDHRVTPTPVRPSQPDQRQEQRPEQCVLG